ncbi:hypothetical protein SCALM49S_01806 [Streptomyces californicus]
MHLAEGIPQDKDPAERKRWWDGLSEEQRQEYLKVAPDLIGDLDGIPAVMRDEANRRHLPLLIEALERRGGDDAKDKIDALRMLQDKLEKPSNPPMFLLGIGSRATDARSSRTEIQTRRSALRPTSPVSDQADGDFVEEEPSHDGRQDRPVVRKK